MRAGELRNRIVIEANTPTRNSVNEEVAHWATFATLWAKVQATAGTEQIDQQRATAIVHYTIIVRSYPGITSAMRVNWDATYFDIQAVIDDPASGEMQLICSEVVSG